MPKAGKIFFTGDSATIFSNVINHGSIGVGKNALLNFNGKIWENDALSQITDESKSGTGITGEGGWIRFISDNGRQQIWGGYNAASKTGASFPRLKILNGSGVELMNGSTKVRNELNFVEGHIYLRDQIMVIGNATPGIISGYDSSRYFVTGNIPGSGLLIRENMQRSDGYVTFPVGSRENAYTPAALRNNSAAGDDYYVSVFDSTRESVISGRSIVSAGVNKTWQVGKRDRQGKDVTDVLLQHLISDEGTTFAFNRKNAFVSQCTNSSWDIGFPQYVPGDGNLTTGAILKNSGINSREFTGTIGASSYFTKLTGSGNSSLYKTKLMLNAYRLNYQQVFVYWTTHPEVDVNYFVVQRRLSNEADYSNRDTVKSKINGGLSLYTLNYSITDPNNYEGLSFYRLLIVSYNGDTTYSNMVVVPGRPGGIAILWPNPTTGRFYAGISSPQFIKTIAIYDAVGQLMRREEVYNRSLIEMYLNIPGTYMVSFIGYNGRIIETKKLVVGGH